VQYEKALELAVSSLGENHLYTSEACTALGELNYDAEYGFASAEYYERAIAIRKALLATDHIDTVQLYQALAVVYESMGEKNRAMEANQSASDICERLGISLQPKALLYINGFTLK
jgi:tetratricopeptide (TPR) repeat protein